MGTTAIDPLTLKVYTKAAWGDSWTLRTYLEPVKASNRLQPDIPAAEFRFRYGSIAREGATSFSAETPLSLIENFVKITATWATESGTTTGLATGKLIDSGADFSSILPGTPVFNTSDGTATAVQAVDSGTQLTLDVDIFDLGNAYTVGGEALLWIGFFPESVNSIFGSASGDQTLHAVGLEALLDRVIVDGAVCEGANRREITSGTTNGAGTNLLVDTGGSFTLKGVLAGHEAWNETDSTTADVTNVISTSQLGISADIFASGEDYVIRSKLLDRNILFNERHAGGDGGARGNRSTAVNADGVYEFSTDGEVWTYEQIVGYLLEYFGARGITWQLAASNSLLGALKRSYDPYGRSTRDNLSSLIDRRMGLRWYVETTGDADATIYVHVVSGFDTDITEGSLTVTANASQVDLPVNDSADPYSLIDVASVELTEHSRDRYDVILVRGARIKSCFTVSAADTAGGTDGTLEEAWTSAQETAYETGVPGGLGTADENDAYRKQPLFERVFRHYRVPADFDWQVGDGEGAAKTTAAPGVDKDGDIDSSMAGSYWNGHMPLCEHLPLKVGVDYSAEPIADNSPTDAEPQYQRPFAVLEKDGDYFLAHSLREVSEHGSCRVAIASRESGIIVSAPAAHLLADNHWAGNDTNVEPEFDWEDMAITVCAELAERPYRKHVLTDSRFGSRRPRTLIIDVDECEVHWLASNTVLGVNSDGSLAKFPGTSDSERTIRDDTDMLEAVMAAARAWYGRDRNALTYSRRRIIANLAPGVLVKTIDNAGSSSNVGTVVELREYDFDRRTTSCITGLGGIDFARFATVDQRVKLERNVKQIARDVRDLKRGQGDKVVRHPDPGAGRSPVAVDKSYYSATRTETTWVGLPILIGSQVGATGHGAQPRLAGRCAGLSLILINAGSGSIVVQFRVKNVTTSAVSSATASITINSGNTVSYSCDLSTPVVFSTGDILTLEVYAIDGWTIPLYVEASFWLSLAP